MQRSKTMVVVCGALAALIGCTESSGSLSGDGGKGSGASADGGGQGGGTGQGGTTGGGMGGAGGGTPSGSFSTGVDSGKKLNALDAADIQKVCNAEKAFFQSSAALSAQNVCKLAGYVAAAFAVGFGAAKTDQEAQAACTKAVDDCVKTPPPDKTSSKELCTAAPADCTATIGELEACMAAVPGYFQMTFAVVPECSKVTLAELMKETDPTEVPEPAACKTFGEKCKDLDPTDLVGDDDEPAGQ